MKWKLKRTNKGRQLLPSKAGFHVTDHLELEPFSRIVHVECMQLPDQRPTR